MCYTGKQVIIGCVYVSNMVHLTFKREKMILLCQWNRQPIIHQFTGKTFLILWQMRRRENCLFLSILVSRHFSLFTGMVSSRQVAIILLSSTCFSGLSSRQISVQWGMAAFTLTSKKKMINTYVPYKQIHLPQVHTHTPVNNSQTAPVLLQPTHNSVKKSLLALCHRS